MKDKIMKQKIVLATGNKGKVKEMADVLADFGFEVIAQTDLGIESPEETGLTFVENAILKARYASEKSGLPAIADDSGLVVDALNGAPGLYSARYAGVDGDEADAKNREKLLAELADVPTERRQAKFVSTICFPSILGVVVIIILYPLILVKNQPHFRQLILISKQLMPSHDEKFSFSLRFLILQKYSLFLG